MVGVKRQTISSWLGGPARGKTKRFINNLREYFWRKHRNLSGTVKIYKRGKVWMTVSTLKKYGISHSVAASRLPKWVRGEITFEELINKQKHYETGSANWDLSGMQPRRTLGEIGGLGTWEKKQF
jgi:hypothetical protein